MSWPEGYRAEILADSVAEGARLTTFLVRFPRFILAEVNTHRMLSRNSASSRAIPLAKRVAAVREDPFVPHAFGKNQPGMQSSDEVEADAQHAARVAWREAAYAACNAAERLGNLQVHKQWASRLLEPYLWHEAILTATEWSNFFHLRDNPQAQPEFQFLARCMKAAMDASTPVSRRVGEWHLPLVDERDAGLPLLTQVKLSVARCARVSYLTHDGRRDPDADLALCERLAASGHLSPFEHAAVVAGWDRWAKTGNALVAKLPNGRYATSNGGSMIGNFSIPWVQYRKFIHGEADILGGGTP